MLVIPWLNAHKGILRFIEIAILDHVHCIKPIYNKKAPPKKNQSFTNHIRHKMVKGTPTLLKRFVVAIFLVPEARVGDAVAQLFEIKAVGLSRKHMAALNHERQSDCSFCSR